MLLRRKQQKRFESSSRGQSKRFPWRIHRLSLEQLEDRAAPAVVNWTGAAGDFNRETPGNWDSGTVPGSADDVVTNASGITVPHASNASESIDSLTSANLNWQNGELTLRLSRSV